MFRNRWCRPSSPRSARQTADDAVAIPSLTAAAATDTVAFASNDAEARRSGMRRLSAILVLILAAAACASTAVPTAPAPANQTASSDASTNGASERARYRLTFDATWSGATHPVDFPSAAHFSSLVGGTHDASVSFWREGVLATQGIQDMAERGRTSPLDQEIEAAIRGGGAERVWVGGSINPSPGTASLEFEISQRYPLATFVSMIAPSPDWFVGVSGLALFQNGQWVNERRVDLIPWDAGTDSGTTFTSPDRDTQPRTGISRILSVPLASAGSLRPLGTFTFTIVRPPGS